MLIIDLNKIDIVIISIEVGQRYNFSLVMFCFESSAKVNIEKRLSFSALNFHGNSLKQ